tara:strand:+ start:25702 stop:26127 length:426 start_codon:yes stop_codon:yes gene_type:complete
MKIAAILCMAGLVGVANAAPPPPAEKLADNPRIVAMYKESVRRRQAYRLGPQTLDEKCCKVAQDWAEYLAKNHYFHHGGGEQIIAAGYPTVESAFGGWMGSRGHRYWVLSRTEFCGWGCAESSTGRWYWVGCFRTKQKGDK